ncbi:MAG: hypothetical protein WAM29_14535, partial [Methylocella sp.]
MGAEKGAYVLDEMLLSASVPKVVEPNESVVIMGWPAAFAAIRWDRGLFEREERTDGHLHHW